MLNSRFSHTFFIGIFQHFCIVCAYIRVQLNFCVNCTYVQRLQTSVYLSNKALNTSYLETCNNKRRKKTRPKLVLIGIQRVSPSKLGIPNYTRGFFNRSDMCEVAKWTMAFHCVVRSMGTTFVDESMVSSTTFVWQITIIKNRKQYFYRVM